MPSEHIEQLPFFSNGLFGDQVLLAFIAYIETVLTSKQTCCLSIRDYDYSKCNLSDYIIYDKDTRALHGLRRLPIALKNAYSTYTQLCYNFFRTTFCNSQFVLNNYKPVDDRLLFHIRFSDYASVLAAGNNYADYIENACRHYNEKFPELKNADILTDFGNIVKSQYVDIIAKHFNIGNWLYSNDMYNDMMKSASYKYRVCTNSSYTFICAMLSYILHDKDVYMTQIKSLANFEENLDIFNIVL